MFADFMARQKTAVWSHKVYHTVWSEIDVSCVTCQGPASRHVAWDQRMPGFELIDAKTKGLIVQLDERLGSQWTINLKRAVNREGVM